MVVIRRRKRLTQAEVAMQMATAPSRISTVESGRVPVSEDFRRRYARALGELGPGVEGEPLEAWTPRWIAREIGGEPRFMLTRRELAALLGRSEKTVARYEKSGRLEATRLTAGATTPPTYSLTSIRRFLDRCVAGG